MANKKETVKCLENIIKGSAQARKWYLKTDLKVRLKLLVDEDHGFDEFINLWKRLNIIRKDFADSYQEIIDEAVQELSEKWLFWKYSGKREKVLKFWYGNNRFNKPIIQGHNRGIHSVGDYVSGKG